MSYIVLAIASGVVALGTVIFLIIYNVRRNKSKSGGAKNGTKKTKL